MSRKIIVLAGLPISGKTTYPLKIGPKYNIPFFETGKIVLDEVTKRDLEFTPENVKAVTDECKKISDSYFTERLMDKIDLLESSIKAVFIIGIRATSEIDVLKKHYGENNVSTIAFHASLKTRYQRLMNEDRQSESKGAKAKEDLLLREHENFVARNKKELGYGVGSVIALADYMIVTEDAVWPYATVEQNVCIFEMCIREILEF